MCVVLCIGTKVSEEPAASMLKIKGGKTSLSNAGIYLQNYTTQHQKASI
jgi:hypothetical protein